MKLFGLFISLFLFTGQTFADNIDPSKSEVNWYGSKIVGKSHNGTIKIKSGKLTWGKSNFEKGEVVIDMKTIVNLDLASETFNKKLVNHLSSDDFFDVKKFPEATFKSTKVTHVKDDLYSVRGDMTIKGKTNTINFLAKMKKTGSVITGRGEIKFNRADFDVRYGSDRFFDNLGDKVISDEIKLNFILVSESKK